MKSNDTNQISQQSMQKLKELAKQSQQGITPLFNNDKNRVTEFSYEINDLYFDFSKTHISEELINTYKVIAEEINFGDKRKALFTGEKINNTEQRSVLHTLLRNSENQGIKTVDTELLTQAKSAKDLFLQQYKTISEKLDARQHSIKNIIHVGIGGSALGTQLIIEALRKPGQKIKVHFLGNIDAHQLDDILIQCSPQTTMVIGVSKTFSTAETLQNLSTIKKWFVQQGQQSLVDSFYAVTANPIRAVEYGIHKDNIVEFPQWVGGRYSVWSSVSLSAAIVLGFDVFEQLLEGAAVIDQHFYQTTIDNNLCYLAAALDHFYINHLSTSSKGIFAYDYRLRFLVDYLQQLETESNGKNRQRNGKPVNQLTSPIIWGGVGTDVQHSVFQLLHQGTSPILAEFIMVKNADHEHIEHHRELLANGIAQTAALLKGQNLETTELLHAEEKLSKEALLSKVFDGERPSITILLEQIDAKTLGSLLAFYEHRTFCAGILTNINSFDQMGVELGKRLAKQLKPMLNNDTNDTQESLENSSVDASTQALIKRIRD